MHGAGIIGWCVLLSPALQSLAAKHYAEHEGKPFFEKVCTRLQQWCSSRSCTSESVPVKYTWDLHQHFEPTLEKHLIALQ